MSALFELTVPGYIRGLEQLSHVLEIGESWAETHSIPHVQLLSARLAPDMHALPFQIWSASNTAKAFLHRVAGIPEVPMVDDQTEFASLQRRLQDTIALLRQIKPDDLIGKGHEPVTLNFRRQLHFETGFKYLQVYGIPNFWFHVTAAYAILRNQGVPVGKMDYIGKCW